MTLSEEIEKKILKDLDFVDDINNIPNIKVLEYTINFMLIREKQFIKDILKGINKFLLDCETTKTHANIEYDIRIIRQRIEEELE